MSDEKKKIWAPDVHLKLGAQPSPVALRDHQLAAHDRMTAHFSNEKKKAGFIVVPTAGSKTLLAAHWLLSRRSLPRPASPDLGVFANLPTEQKLSRCRSRAR